MGGVCSTLRERTGVYRIWVGRPEGKSPLVSPRHDCDDIKMDLQQVECGGMDWIDLADDRNRWRALVGAVMNRGVV